MTDDNGAGEGPYKVDTFQACEPWKRLIAVGPSIRFGENGIPPNCGEMVDLLNIAHAEGRKAERKRCARIAKLNCTVEEIVDMIMGGQDGE